MTVTLKALGPVRHGEKSSKSGEPGEVKDLKAGDTFTVQDDASALDLIATGAAEATSESELKRLIDKVGLKQVGTIIEPEADEKGDRVIAKKRDYPPAADPQEGDGLSQMARLHKQLKARLEGKGKKDDDAGDETVEERRQRTTFEEEPTERKKSDKTAKDDGADTKR